MSAYRVQGSSGYALSPATSATTNMTNKLTSTGKHHDQTASGMTRGPASPSSSAPNSWTSQPQRTTSGISTRPPISSNILYPANNSYTGKPLSSTAFQRQRSDNITPSVMTRPTNNTSVMPTYSGHMHSAPSQHQHQQHQDSLQGHMARSQESEADAPVSKSPATDFTTAQLLQFVGLPTNLAGQLAPQKYEPKRRVKQTPLSLQTIARKSDPIVPKPGAPLPPNLVDDIKGALPSGEINVPKPSAGSTRQSPTKGSITMVTSNSNKPNNILGILRQPSNFGSSVKRMSLKDYKSSRDAATTRTTKIEIQSRTPETNKVDDNRASVLELPDKDAEGFVIPHVPEKDADGFVIPRVPEKV